MQFLWDIHPCTKPALNKNFTVIKQPRHLRSPAMLFAQSFCILQPSVHTRGLVELLGPCDQKHNVTIMLHILSNYFFKIMQLIVQQLLVLMFDKLHELYIWNRTSLYWNFLVNVPAYFQWPRAVITFRQCKTMNQLI